MGVEPVAPPPMSKQAVRLMPWLIATIFVFLAANFYLFFQLGGRPGFSNWPLSLQVLEIAVILLLVVVGLVLSFLTFQRVLRAERPSTGQSATWNRAIDNWNRLYYCLRDHTAFDPQQQRPLSEAELRSLISPDQALVERDSSQTNS